MNLGLEHESLPLVNTALTRTAPMTMMIIAAPSYVTVTLVVTAAPRAVSMTTVVTAVKRSCTGA